MLAQPSQAVELLAPARDLQCGITAIDCGADAVYIGAPSFGARSAAGNSLEEIKALAEYAHRYWARVYITLNTLLRDDEIDAAVALAWQLYECGIDGLIVQDMGLLESKLPPLPLIASTQVHNHTPERVAFLEQTGFHRAILARELSLDEIRTIRNAAPSIELECFVHGALCVCYSGQCYLSYALGGRSGNRGQCAQPCRKRYDLLDESGNSLVRGRHLLSIRDLNLSGSLRELVDAGITSFKIEGRLKDARYVANVVAYYSARLNELGVRRSSSGHSRIEFTPDLAKAFNRGFTSYFLHGKREKIGSHMTPKMVGEPAGIVQQIRSGAFALGGTGAIQLHPGDGLCFFDRAGELHGTLVNAVAGRVVTPEKMDGLQTGLQLFRNHDHEFMSSLDRGVARLAPSSTTRVAGTQRRIEMRFTLRDGQLQAEDEDSNTASVAISAAQPAAKPEAALTTLRRQLEKTGDSEFCCVEIKTELSVTPFLPVSAINSLRRQSLDELRRVRAETRPQCQPWKPGTPVPFPEHELTYLGNVLNQRSAAFYRRHGVTQIEPAAESGLDMRGRRLMLTRYCLKYELGMCGKPPKSLKLVDEEGRRLELRFDCARCQMHVYLG